MAVLAKSFAQSFSRTNTFSLIAFVLCTAHFSCYAAATILQDCFSVPASYFVIADSEINAADNKANNILQLDGHAAGSGPDMEANCACPGNLMSNTQLNELTAAGSPLPAGTQGYGFLTDYLDIDIAGYSDSNQSADGSGLFKIAIDKYPTPTSSMNYLVESRLKSTEATASVCSTDTRPSGGTTVKRVFRWSVIGVTLYVKKPILGVEKIPATIVATNYACLYFGSGSCSVSSTTHVSNIWLSGSISAPLSCTINEGSTIEVEMAPAVTSQFVHRGEIPSGYTLKNFDVSYHCDNPASAEQAKIKLTLTADQGVVDESIARTLGRDDLGIRLFDGDDNDVKLDGTQSFAVVLDEQGNGRTQLKAAPVSITSAKPTPGPYESNVTVKMDLR